MRYDIADHQCKAVLTKVLDTGAEIDLPSNAASSAMDDANTASRSHDVGAALRDASTRLSVEVSYVHNFYNLAVGQASYAVTLYQGGDEKMAKDAFDAALKTDTDADPRRQRQQGGRAHASAI